MNLLQSGRGSAHYGAGKPVLERELELFEAGDLERIGPARGLNEAQALIERLVALEQQEDAV